jgi:phospholipid/cholesterol/gamma-HCH transport system permease protein
LTEREGGDRADELTNASELFGDRVSRVAGLMPTFAWRSSETADASVIELGGEIVIDDAAAIWTRVSAALEQTARGRLLRIDCSAVERIDGACMALLAHLRDELRARGARCEFVGATPQVRRIIDLYTRRSIRRPRRPRRGRNAVEQIGQASVDFFSEVVAVLSFIGELASSAWHALRRPSSLNPHDIALTMERAGADAAPIVLLINFLIGFVMAYQSAPQLEQFGANIYIADLVGVAMTRELGPLMTAVIVCGRTGAAFTAELGTMKVSEEVDALRTMGLVPLRYLVVPRVLGLMLVLPLLTLLADIVGIASGMLVGVIELDIAPRAYFTQTLSAVTGWDVWSGVLKSVAFAAAIGLIACQQGLATAGGAEGVGRRTTSAVVSILFSLILLDALFTVVFGVIES